MQLFSFCTDDLNSTRIQAVKVLQLWDKFMGLFILYTQDIYICPEFTADFSSDGCFLGCDATCVCVGPLCSVRGVFNHNKPSVNWSY